MLKEFWLKILTLWFMNPTKQMYKAEFHIFNSVFYVMQYCYTSYAVPNITSLTQANFLNVTSIKSSACVKLWIFGLNPPRFKKKYLFFKNFFG